MNILFYVFPFTISILVVFLKRKIVNEQSGKLFAKREMFLDGVKILIIAFVAMIANLLIGKDIPIWTLSIEVLMMIVYLLPLLQKNYNYIERKALMGVFASIIFMLVIAITIFQMLIGTYKNEDATLFYCFIKAVSYFFIAIWACFTTGKKSKVRSIILELKSSFVNYQIGTLEYYMFAFLALFVLLGGNNNIYPVGIFGVHEILNRKSIKGIIYIVLGNISIFLKFRYPLIGSVAFTLYTLVALVDLIIQFVKILKSK